MGQEDRERLGGQQQLQIKVKEMAGSWQAWMNNVYLYFVLHWRNAL